MRTFFVLKASFSSPKKEKNDRSFFVMRRRSLLLWRLWPSGAPPRPTASTERPLAATSPRAKAEFLPMASPEVLVPRGRPPDSGPRPAATASLSRFWWTTGRAPRTAIITSNSRRVTGPAEGKRARRPVLTERLFSEADGGKPKANSSILKGENYFFPYIFFFVSFTFPDGSQGKFSFVADENGYRVESPLLPVGPAAPPHALAQIEKAEYERAQGIVHDGSYLGGSSERQSVQGHGFQRPNQAYNF